MKDSPKVVYYPSDFPASSAGIVFTTEERAREYGRACGMEHVYVDRSNIDDPGNGWEPGLLAYWASVDVKDGIFVRLADHAPKQPVHMWGGAGESLEMHFWARDLKDAERIVRDECARYAEEHKLP